MGAYPERLTGKREVRAEHPDIGKSLPNLADNGSIPSPLHLENMASLT
jgi:hypothetical protein